MKVLEGLIFLEKIIKIQGGIFWAETYIHIYIYTYIHIDRHFQKPVFYDQEGHRNDVGPLNFFLKCWTIVFLYDFFSKKKNHKKIFLSKQFNKINPLDDKAIS